MVSVLEYSQFSEILELIQDEFDFPKTPYTERVLVLRDSNNHYLSAE